MARCKKFKESGVPKHLKKGIIHTDPENPVSDEQIAGIQATFGLEKVAVTFGTDETCGVIFVNQKPLPHTQVKIVSNGKVAGANTPGTLHVKGWVTFCDFLLFQQGKGKKTQKTNSLLLFFCAVVLCT